MRRYISVMCILFLLFSVSAYTQPVTAGTSQTVQDTGDLFAISPASFTSPGKVNTLIPLSDGRVILGGRFVSVGVQAAPGSLAILKTDGTVDPNFQVDPNLLVYELYAAALQPDGKIVIAGWFHHKPVPLTVFLLRLNASGSLDNSFNTIYFNSQVRTVLIDGGKILIGGGFTLPTPYISRLNSDGSADPTFNGVGSGPSAAVWDIARQSSGKYIITGEFSSFNGLDRAGLARLNANGSLDASFTPVGSWAGKTVAVLNDNSVLVGGENPCNGHTFSWFTADGAAKTTLDPDPNILESITALLPLPDGGFLIGGWYSSWCYESNPTHHEGQIRRYASNGDYQTMTTFGDASDILTLALRSDGKVLAGGQGDPKTPSDIGLFNGLALLDISANGLEKVAAFHPLVGDETDIFTLSRYSDEKLLVAGKFTHVNGSPRFGLARLLANGSLDPDFHPFADKTGGWSNAALALPDGRSIAGFADSNLYLIGLDGSLTDLSAINHNDRVSALVYQMDGKVLVGTDFGLGVRRLKADFSGEDSAFTPGNANGRVLGLTVQTGGKILVAGDFSLYNTIPVPGLVLLNSDGSIDGSFSPPVFMLDQYNTAAVYSAVRLSSGNVLVGGNFTKVGGEDRSSLVNLTGAGAIDSGFSSPAGVLTVHSIGLQGDGSIWIGGNDSSYFRNPAVYHLDANGQIDSTFQSVFQAAHDTTGVVNALLCDNNGLRWVGGKFSSINGIPGLARYFPLVGQVFLPRINR